MNEAETRAELIDPAYSLKLSEKQRYLRWPRCGVRRDSVLFLFAGRALLMRGEFWAGDKRRA